MLRHFCLFADFTGADANPWAILDDGLLDKLLRTRTGQNGNVPFEALPAKASEPVRKQISAEFKSWTKSPKFVAGAPLEAVGLGGKTALMRVLDLDGASSDLALLLVGAGADIKSVDARTGFTALQSAVKQEGVQIMPIWKARALAASERRELERLTQPQKSSGPRRM